MPRAALRPSPLRPLAETMRGAGIRSPARQRGLAMLVLLALFAMAAAFMLVSSLNKSSIQLALTRAEKNRAVLQQAKAALIAWSAAQVLLNTTAIPGGLPCPDIVNKGVAPGSCGSTALLGRLPYLTLGIDDLRDASGERLWYALSANFRNYTGTINSDTQGTLSVSGLAPATNVVAVVFAPGARVGTQDRSPDETTCAANNDSSQHCNTASNYLEDVNGTVTTTAFKSAIENLSNPSMSPYPFNDQLLAITQQDLLSAIEPLIAARIRLTGYDIVADYIYNNDPSLTDSGNKWSDDNTKRDKSRYFDAWGGFPFAANFVDQTGGSPSVCSPASIYKGAIGTYEGLLPVVNCLSYTWSSGTIIKTGGSGTVSGNSCSPINGANDLKCSITYSAFSQPTIRIAGTVPGVGFSFVQLTRLSDVSIDYSALASRTLSGSLDSSGNGIVTLDATLPFNFSFSNRTVHITISNSNLITSQLVSSSDAVAGWFVKNGWYKQTYYAVSPGYAPGGSGSCSPSASPKCLSVYNLLSPYTNPTTDTLAILVFGGRSLSGTTRPNGTRSDYLEGQNASSGDYTFEHASNKTSALTGGSPYAINDRVIVVAP